MKTNTAITAMIVAFVAMIGMTGLAMAGSTTGSFVGDGQYNINFDGAGTGDLTFITQTSFGTDYQNAEWSNAEIVGSQHMTPQPTWTEIDRDTMITGTVNGAKATGQIVTQSTDNSGDRLTAVAQYHDDDAYGSNVMLSQVVGMGTLSGMAEPGVGSPLTHIAGYSYGADTYVGGSVSAVSNGVNNVSVGASIGMDEGSMNMDVMIGTAVLPGGDEGAGLDLFYMEGVGDGVAQIYGRSTDSATANFDFDDPSDGIHNDGIGYYPGGTINGNPVTVNLFDDFDTNYDATGYIYVVTP